MVNSLEGVMSVEVMNMLAQVIETECWLLIIT